MSFSSFWQAVVKVLSPPVDKPSCVKGEDESPPSEVVARERVRLETAVTSMTAEGVRDAARTMRERGREYKKDVDQFERALSALIGDMHGGGGNGSSGPPRHSRDR